jgi:molybdenum cofactor biosynthesis protein B
MKEAGEGPKHHRETAAKDLGVFVLTVSDTRTPETDHSGRLVLELVEGAGQRITGAAIVPDDPGRIQAAVQLAVEEHDTDVVLITGGTGIARRDTTVDTVRPMLRKELDGYGELFRMLSFREIGSAAMLSRAVAGIITDKVVFVMPGSSGAVKLAMNQLILPEIGHIVRELRKTGSN